MSDDPKVTKLNVVQGDGFIAAVNEVLDEAKDQFVKVVLVGERADGSYAVAGTHGAPEAVMLLQWGSNYLVTNRVDRK